MHNKMKFFMDHMTKSLSAPDLEVIQGFLYFKGDIVFMENDVEAKVLIDIAV